MLPGNGLSETPPDHKSTSEGCLEKIGIDKAKVFEEDNSQFELYSLIY